ncbi:DUF2723 domain-containing protein [bacterium]|nr:DUF2723 domain-containing protein [bacterium]
MHNKIIFCLGIAFLFIRFIPLDILLGEGPLLASAGYHLGISHPPGYPLYLHLIKLISLLPLGSVVYRSHLLSLLIGLGIFWLYHSLFRSIAGRFSFFVAIFIFFIPSCLESILKTEVYAFNLLCFGLFLHCWLRWRTVRDIRWLYFFSFFAGMSLTHHLTLLIFIPVFVLSASGSHKWVSKRFVLLPFTLFLMGCSIWLYLPLRSSGHPVVNWGDPVRFDKFISLITAQDEAIPSVLDTCRVLSGKAVFMRMYHLLEADFFWVWLLIAGYGLYRGLCKDRNLIVVLSILFLLSLCSVSLYHSNESRFFFLPGLMIICCWIAIGLESLYETLHISYKNMSQKSPLYFRSVIAIALILSVITGCCFGIIDHCQRVSPLFQGVDALDLTLFGRGLIGETSAHAYIFTEYSNLFFLLWYQQYIEGFGQDRIVIFRHLLSFPWYFEGQYFGKIPIESGLAINQYAENSASWNATITAALILAGLRHSSVHVLEQNFFRQYQSTWFKSFNLVHARFSYLITDSPSFSIEKPQHYSTWFQNYTKMQRISRCNTNFYSYYIASHTTE